MTNSRSAVFLAALACLWISCGNASAQNVDHSSTSSKPSALSLNFTNNGQRLFAVVGQQIEITLGTVGPKQYGDPEVSSPAIRLESVELAGPQNPGGPTFVYFFEAAAKGEAEVRIPIVNSEDADSAKRLTFAVTIQIKAARSRTLSHAFMTPDQVNIAPWQNAWTNLLNDARQSFKPSLPRLAAVEVQLVVANPGPSDADVVMSVLNAEGEVISVVSKTVPVIDCGHALFIFPNGGLQVLPGQVYSIRLNAGSLFGWKYVVGGYVNGAATFNGKPLLPNARSTFLFRTFGAG